eukprot:PITA_24678
MHAPATPLHPVVTVGPFAKWGIDYVTCNPHSAGGHGYIIVAVDYFTKWAKAMPTLSEDGHTAAQFIFNPVIARFGVPQAIVPDHGKHFRNHMMVELTTQLGLRHDSSSPYYPQANEEWLLYLERLDETRRLASLAIEAQKKRVKTHFDNSDNPRSFVEGDLVLLYDQASDKLGAGKLEPMWHGPYIVKIVMQKGAYELIDYEGNPLDRPRNGLYLKKYYA